jgi:hypothetical protein
MHISNRCSFRKIADGAENFILQSLQASSLRPLFDYRYFIFLPGYLVTVCLLPYMSRTDPFENTIVINTSYKHSCCIVTDCWLPRNSTVMSNNTLGTVTWLRLRM